MLSEFSLLLFGEVLLIAGFTLERKRVKRILGMLFVEDIILTVLPIGEILLVRGALKDGFPFIVC